VTGPLGSWELQVPHLVSVHPLSRPWAPADRCSTVAAPPVFGTFPNQFTAKDYWDGIRLGGVSGGGDLISITTDPRLVKPTMPVDFKWMTKDGWFFSCPPALQSGQGGQGFVGYSPDGVKYTFDWMAVRSPPAITQLNASGVGEVRLPRGSVRIYATRVEDRFGNRADYDWQGDRLTRIHGNDGREITLAYIADGTLKTATAGNRVWTYVHDLYRGLTDVINPDQTRWTYQRQGTLSIQYKRNPSYPNHASNEYLEAWPLFCSKVNVIDPHTTTLTVMHPSGALATYTFSPVRHGRNNVPYACMEGTDDNWRNDYNAVPVFHEVMSLQHKRVEGTGLAAATTSYSYAALEGSYDSSGPPGPPPAPSNRKLVTVTHPDQTQTVHTFGKDYGIDEGRLLKEEVRRAGITLQTTTHAYMDDAQAAGQAFAHNLGSSFVIFGDPLNTSRIRPLLSTTVVRDGTSFSRTHASFDAHARPLQQVRASSLGYSRTEVTAYHDHLAKWVLGQVALVKCVAPASCITSDWPGGIELSKTTYSAALAQPEQEYAFGKLKQVTAWNAATGTDQAGTLKSVADGAGNVIQLSSWKRGVPRLIRHPATPEAPAGATQSAVVDDHGWITSVTDEVGATTSYQHDVMGRLT